MVIGIPKEIKSNENRVAITPSGVLELVGLEHTVLVEQGAGLGSGISDEEYMQAGAKIMLDKVQLFHQSDMIMKVKEPLENEYSLFHDGQILFTYLHLAPNLPLTKALLAKKVTGVAYETIETGAKTLPLLTPMSEVAGRMSVQVGATMLQKYYGGLGMLLGGVPGVLPAEVVIVGGGVVGTNAAKMALGLGANVTILDINASRLRYLDDIFWGKSLRTLICTEYHIAQMCKKADLLISAVLVPGAAAPKIVKEKMVETMKKGAVIVDVAIDQGGSVETIDRVTTHDNPTFEKHGVVHYSVANMPGAVPHTSTYALASATLPYAVKIANGGVDKLRSDKELYLGVNTFDGKLTNLPVSQSTGIEYVPFCEI